ncbi:MAG TPA: hypothetical protein EYN06_00850 [Myxococcales bacterium]|nr:hypothetical protein [Myxococcales bacterium]
MDKCKNGECQNIAVGLACEDGNPCTAGDICIDGNCTAGTILVNCNDGNPCSIDSCDTEKGCISTAGNDGTDCNDGDTCTSNDSCVDGTCSGGTATVCDDKDVCTKDTCVDGVGCVFEAGQGCNDSNPCTQDICDPDVGCLNNPMAEDSSCGDGNPCTTNDLCKSGICEGTLDPNSCDDKNECTDDSCFPDSGCKHSPVANDTPCDDGDDATLEDTCNSGKCQGLADDCSSQITPSDPTLKITNLSVSSTEKMDIDGNGSMENTISLVAPFLGTALSDPITSGQLKYLAHPDGFGSTAPFPVHFFSSVVAPSNAACDYQKNYCDYELESNGFDESCVPVATLPSNIYQGTTLKTTEPGLVIIPMVFEATTVELTIYMAQLDVNLTLNNGVCDSFTGLLGGAVKIDELVAIMNQVPSLKPLAGLVEILLTPDIDTDDDGTADAVSIVLSAVGIGGKIVGVVEQP